MITKRPEHAANILNLDCGDGCTIVYLLKNHLIVYLKQVHFKMWEFTSVNIFFFFILLVNVEEYKEEKSSQIAQS